MAFDVEWINIFGRGQFSDLYENNVWAIVSYLIEFVVVRLLKVQLSHKIAYSQFIACGNYNCSVEDSKNINLHSITER